MTDAEKLLAAVRSGEFSKSEMNEIGQKLMGSLTPEQRAMLQSLTYDEKKRKEFLSSEPVRKILGGQK